MNTYANKIPENKPQTVTNDFSRQQQNDAIQLASNYSELVVDNTERTEQLKSTQQMATGSRQVQQLKAYQAMANHFTASIVQRKENKTGLPDTLKSGIENLSGYSMDDVKVHYNSSQPAQLNAHAYAQGNQIHIASGQEKHLPHEAWHVVQQKQGRVKPTMQLKGMVAINDDSGLEKEADVMGAEAIRTGNQTIQRVIQPTQTVGTMGIAQLKGTKITHKPGALHFAGKPYMVGLEMNAVLDPDDPVRGSATTADNYDFMKGMNVYYKKPGIVRGHLLNHDLGGYGVPENLYPITSLANSQHSERVEQKVKGALYRSAALKGHKRDIIYNVVVDQNGRSGFKYENVDFKCDWTDENGVSHDDVIKSRFHEDEGWSGRSTKEQSPPKWQHKKRRGELDFSDEILNKKIEISDSFLKGVSQSDYAKLKTDTEKSTGVTDDEDWEEALKMYESELLELRTVENPKALSVLFKNISKYYDWLKKEYADAKNANNLKALTSKESKRMMQNLVATRKHRIYLQDGLDAETNISDEIDEMDLVGV